MRILIIGDSFSFGEEVSNHETFAHILESILENVEVINLGIHGYGHDQMLLYLKEEGLKYHPDIVILGYLEMDKERNLLSFRDFAKPKFKLTENGLNVTHIPVPLPKDVFKNEFFKLKILDLIFVLKYKLEMKFGIFEKRSQKIADAILDDFVKTIRESGAVPVFAYIQNLRSKDDMQMTPDEELFFSKWKKENVHCIYLRKLFFLAQQNGYIFDDTSKYGHYGPNENALIAVGIGQYLKKNKLVP